MKADDNDSDGDGISDYDEIHGYTVFGRTYFTDPYSESTDGDPYDDYTEITGINMPNWVADPGRHPCIPSYPVLRVDVERIEVTAKTTIISTSTIETFNGWELETETTEKNGWKFSLGIDVPLKVVMDNSLKDIKVKPTIGYEHATTTKTLHSTSGWRREEWSTATAIDPDSAAKLVFHIRIKNEGTDAAKNIRFRFNVKIGEDTLASTVYTDIIQYNLEPGESSAEMEIPREGEIAITLDELKSIECGALVTVEVTEIEAEVRDITQDLDLSWQDFVENADPVSANVTIGFVDGQAEDYRVWSGIHRMAEPPYIYVRNVTIRDALNWTVGIEERSDGFYIGWKDGRDVDLAYYTFGFEEEVYDQIVEMKNEKEAAGGVFTLRDLLDIPIRQGWDIALQPPDITAPEIHWAAYSNDMKTIRTCVTDDRDIHNVTAHVKVGSQYVDRLLTDEDGDAIFEAASAVAITDTDDDKLTVHDGTYDRIWEDITVAPGPMKYTRRIPIWNRMEEDLYDFQVPIDFDTESLISDGKMRPDCGDIRFTTETGEELHHWIQSGQNSPDTKIWTKMPIIPSGTSHIYLKYGNDLATSTSNFHNTMEEPPVRYWTRTMGGGDSRWGGAGGVTVDSEDNIIVIGFYVEGDDYIYFIKKYDAEGNLIWSTELGTYGDYDLSGFDAVTVDSEDNVVVVGSAHRGGDYNIMVAKYDGYDGEVISPWPRFFDYWPGNYPQAIAVDSNDDIFIVAGGSIIKYFANGARDWVHEFVELIDLKEIAVDSEDNIIVGGTIFIPDGHASFYVAKHRLEEGEITETSEQWHRIFDSGGSDWVEGMVVDSEDNVMITGTVDWTYVYTLKYNSTGSQKWETPWFFPYPIEITEIFVTDAAVDSEGNLIVTGAFNWGHENYYDPRSRHDWYTMKFNSSEGEPLWSDPMIYNNDTQDFAYGVSVDASNSIIVVGHVGGAHAREGEHWGLYWHVMKFSTSKYVTAWPYYDPAVGAMGVERAKAKPTAHIDSINIEEDEDGMKLVVFQGHGIDEGGSISGHRWRSSKDELLSSASSFSKPLHEFTSGIHMIYFSVQDNDGGWSTLENTSLFIVPRWSIPVLSGVIWRDVEYLRPWHMEVLLPEGTDLSKGIAVHMDVIDATPEDSTDDAYVDLIMFLGELDARRCRVYLNGTGFLREVPDIRELPRVAGEPAFSKHMDENTVAIRLYVGDHLVGLVPPLPHDIDGNGSTDLMDIALTAIGFGADPEHPRWNPIADQNQDNKINVIDIALVAKNFGKDYR